MVKKTYTAPLMKEYELSYSQFLCGSGVSSTKGIGYGGKDDGGTLDPASRRYQYDWDDDEEDEE